MVGPENARLRWVIQRIASGAGSADLESAESPWPILLLCGPSGCGKTHVARGLAEWWPEIPPHPRAVYLPAIDFLREFSDAVELQDVDGFRQRVDRASLLALDDLETLVGRESIQRELVRVVDARREDGLWTVLTCREQPDQGWLPQLASRLAAAWVIPIHPPDVATRQQLIRQLLEQRELRATDEAIRYLTESSPANMHQLRGTILQLEQFARELPHPVGLAELQRLADVGSPQATLPEIAQATARHFRLRLADLRGKSRQSGVVQARSVAMYLARKVTPLSLERIGEYFSGRDHTTVLHACRQIEKRQASDEQLADAISQIQRTLSREAAGSDPPKPIEAC